MLKELHIKNIAIIEDTTITFDKNLVGLLGETGAGKSLIVSSLSLIKGERSDFSLIRDQMKRAEITASFSLSKEYIEDHLELHQYLEDEQLIIKRTLNSDKTTSCYINGSPVTLSQLKNITKDLIDIHSQKENSSIYDSSVQLSYVDRSGSDELTKTKNELINSYRYYKDKQKELERLIEDNKNLDRDYLQFQIDEIEKYDLKENEIEDLNCEFNTLKDIGKLNDSYKQAMHIDEDDISDVIYSISHGLKPLSNTLLGPKVISLIEKLNDVQDNIEDIKQDYERLNVNPYRIDQINERLFALKNLTRRYGKTTKEILDKYEIFKRDLKRVDTFNEEKSKLEKKVSDAYKSALDKAILLSEKRKECAVILSKNINKQLNDLLLKGDGFSIDFQSVPLTIDGIDRCSFMVSLNEGENKKSLEKAASGGEASRLMLALKTVLNELNPVNLLIFDEIDTGISGRQALMVAKKIASISKLSSVIVVSHLPQVVSYMDQGILISKSVNNGRTYTNATKLDDDEIIKCLAKMSSGDSITESAYKHAKELYMEAHVNR